MRKKYSRAHILTFALTDTEEIGLLSPQLLSVMTAALNLNPMSSQLQLKRPMAVTIVPTRQEDLSEYWDNTCVGGPWLAH